LHGGEAIAVDSPMGGRGTSSGASSDGDGDGAPPPGPPLRWEPFVESEEVRPILQPEEYARRVTGSRRRMQAEGSDRRGETRSELHLSQGGGMYDLHERELSSLQQRMRNSRAQTAYAMQQQQGPDGRRDEDLCKICYDRDIEMVLYPCGHFILCRWCAQKVSDCPVCRSVITDVIRTYKA